MFQECIPSIRTVSTKVSDLFIELDDAIEQKESNRKRIVELHEKRERFLNTRGTEALRAIRNWVQRNMEGRLPESFTVGLDAAIGALKNRKSWAACQQLGQATKALVREVKYESLSLQEAAAIACLVSELAEFADAFVALRRQEPIYPTRGATADHAVDAVAKQGGGIEHLVSMLTEVFFDYGEELGQPEDVSASDLRSLLADDIASEELPGVCLAIWAATHGHLSRLNDAIQAGMALVAANGIRSFEYVDEAPLPRELSERIGRLAIKLAVPKSQLIEEGALLVLRSHERGEGFLEPPHPVGLH